MSEMTSNYITVHGRELHYTEWGHGQRETVVMWHGLARTGRDFDDLAEVTARRYRVLCPDTIGRGLSQWSPEPETEYSLAFYGKLATGFVDALGVKSLRWVGTSMGGLIGTLVAAGPLKGRITHLLLNDIGPKIGDAALERIRAYAGNPSRFDTVSQLEQYFRTIYKPFGFLTDAQWKRLTETSTRRTEDGKVMPHYDPMMVMQFTHHPRELDQWADYNRLACKTLCLRGIDSDVLLPETAREMTQRGPKCQLIELQGMGHAPALNVPEQFAIVERFLAG